MSAQQYTEVETELLEWKDDELIEALLGLDEPTDTLSSGSCDSSPDSGSFNSGPCSFDSDSSRESPRSVIVCEPPPIRGTKRPAAAASTPEAKKQQRMQRNRVSAAKSRERK